jgi:hypothetical protein
LLELFFLVVVEVVVVVLVDVEVVWAAAGFVSVVCAKTPVGRASATARATNFNRDFFIFFLLFGAGHYAPRHSHDCDSRARRVNRT